MHEGQGLNPFSSCQSSQYRHTRGIIRDGSLFLCCKTGSPCNHGRLHFVPLSGYRVAHDYLTTAAVDFFLAVRPKKAAHLNFRFLKLQLNHIFLKYMTAATFQKDKWEGQQLEPQENILVLNPYHFTWGTLILTPHRVTADWISLPKQHHPAEQSHHDPLCALPAMLLWAFQHWAQPHKPHFRTQRQKCVALHPRGRRFQHSNDNTVSKQQWSPFRWKS